MKQIGGIFLFLLTSYGLYGQAKVPVNPSLLNGKWDAWWITCPGVSLTDFGVYHFRKSFDLAKKPQAFVIHISADNRYRFFVNGREVCKGPARGDLAHWRFETVDIADHLKEGKNVVAAVVWNYGEYKPLAQVSYKTAFIVQGDGDAEKIINTGSGWKVYRDEAYLPLPARQTTVGPGIELQGEKYPYGWETAGYDDAGWQHPVRLGNGIPRGKFTFWDWALVPRRIPFMENRFQRLKKVVRTENIRADDRFAGGNYPLMIPAREQVKILLDQTFLTTAYPEIIVSGGKDAVVEIRYAEALVDQNGVKGHRARIEGKTMPDLSVDIFKPDGGKNRKFQPLWFRTYRYVELTVTTKDQPVTIEDIYGYYTGYPFEERAYFKSDDPSLGTVWSTGWRTARLCAGETYYDCPFYEQLQYVGDTRIQALISLYVSGDDRLMRKAIDQFFNSLLPVGLTQSRYPSCQPQVIPPFSLIWVEMVYDYWMLRDDREFIRKYLNGIRNVLYWYQQQTDDSGMLGPMDWWNFVDWSFGPWDPQRPVGGTPPGAVEGHSSIITLQYVHALQRASQLFDAYGEKYEAQQYRHLSASLKKSTFELCWNKEKGLLADTPEQTSYSQHANILGILTGMFDNQENTEVFDRMLHDTTLTPATFYFRFYLAEAMVSSGRADDYLSLLQPWKEMLELGLTTFAETPEPARSDCHAWSASPDYHFLSVVAGIRPASPGFKTVSIEPHPGYLKRIEASVPHYAGDIVVKLERKGKRITGTVLLPAGITGNFLWEGGKIPLKEGDNDIDL